WLVNVHRSVRRRRSVLVGVRTRPDGARRVRTAKQARTRPGASPAMPQARVRGVRLQAQSFVEDRIDARSPSVRAPPRRASPAPGVGEADGTRMLRQATASREDVTRAHGCVRAMKIAAPFDAPLRCHAIELPLE